MLQVSRAHAQDSLLAFAAVLFLWGVQQDNTVRFACAAMSVPTRELSSVDVARHGCAGCVGSFTAFCLAYML